MAYYTVNVPVHYKQGDFQDIMQTDNVTIAAKGCALTSATMVFRKWGVNKDPSQFNAAMGINACPFGWDVAPGKAGKEGDVRLIAPLDLENDTRFGWGGYNDYLPPPQWGPIVDALAEGLLPIVEITRPPGSANRNHWMVVYKVDGSTTDPSCYGIVDPATGTERTLNVYIEDPTGETGPRLTSYVIYRPA